MRRPHTKDQRLSRQQLDYAYKSPDSNPMYPIGVASRFPVRQEFFGARWMRSLLPSLLAAGFNRAADAVVRHTTLRNRGDNILAAHRALFRRAGPAPEFVARYDDDGWFGWNRLAGLNPTHLERVPDMAWLRDHMPKVDDGVLHRALGGTRSLAQELAEHRLFCLDYRLLQQALSPPAKRCSRWREKYLPAPVVLLCERPGLDATCALLPVAILIDQPDAPPPNPLYVRDGSPGWRLAKFFVEVADHNHHMGVGHLARGHFTMEAVTLSTRRQLLPEHPLRVLLEPHTRHTLPTNATAANYFSNPAQIYARFYAGHLEETRAIAKLGRAQRDFRSLQVRQDLVVRGVQDGPELYPYRDDALLFATAIDRFVGEFVTLSYATDEAVTLDTQLQNWAAELAAPSGGNFRNLVAGQLDSRATLVRLLAQILFTAGPGHAAHHYAEMHYCRYAPMFPAAAYRPPPTSPELATEQRWLQTIPPIGVASEHFMFSDFGAMRMDAFGQYKHSKVGRLPGMRSPIARLQADLRTVNGQIDVRNRRA